MARTFGKVFTTMWDDDDFLESLGADAKYLYNFLIGQPDLAHSGVITMRIGPWAKRMSISSARVEAALKELHETRYVICDHDEMLALVRSLIRRDKVYAQPNVFKSAADHIYTVPSKLIRRVLAEELERLGEEPMAGETRRLCTDLIGWLRKTSGNPSPKCSAKGLANPSEEPNAQSEHDGPEEGNTAGDKGSDNSSGNPIPRARARAGVPLHLSPTPDPFPEPLIPSPSAPEPITPPTFVDFWGLYPRSVGKGAAKTAWDKALKRGADPFVILGAAGNYAVFCQRTRKDRQYIPHPATWLNQERYEDPPEPEPRQQQSSAPSGHQTYQDNAPSTFRPPK